MTDRLAMMSSIDCSHCGTPFNPKAAERYCCNGCYYVAQLLRNSGLERFYELKGTQTLPPVGSKVFQLTDTAPLHAALEGAEASTDQTTVSMRCSIEGISCIGCVWLIEAIYKRQAGTGRIAIDPRSNTMELTWQRGAFAIPLFAQELQQLGYRLCVYDEAASTDHSDSRQLANRIGLCGFFLLNTMLFTLPGYLGMDDEFFLARLFQMLGGLFATLSLIVGGGYFIARAWQAAKAGVLHIDLPIAAGLIAAFGGSLIGCFTGHTDLIYFDFVATFVFLMLAGRWLQTFALATNRSHLQRQQIGPQQVTVLNGAHAGQPLAIEAVHAGLEYSIAPGEINPVAAQSLDAKSTVSLEWINGEPEPVVWARQKTIPAGAINVGLSSLRCQAQESWADSLLARLLQVSAKTFRNQRLEQILRNYIACVLVIAAIGGGTWFIASADILKALQVLISILIVSCPCALGVALPLCDELAIARLRRSGLFIQSGQIWERLRRVKKVVFDKTGTLTMDTPRLANPQSIEGLDPFAAQALYQLVAQNSHPLARSLREALLTHYSNQSLRLNPSFCDLQEIIGKGVSCTDAGGTQWSLGQPDWLAQDALAPIGARTVLRQNGLLITAFQFVEDVRDDARDSLAALRRRKLDLVILSGDHAERVMRIAAQLDLAPDAAKAAYSPTEKACWIETHAPDTALMIGDGANDRLAFDQAICRGTPVVDRSILEASADFLFFGRSLRCLPQLFLTASQRRRTVNIVFSLAVAYNIVAVSLCLAGMMHPLLAAILMPLSSILTLAIAWLGLGRT